MAKKGNPISVRLEKNRSSDSSRFSEGDRESHQRGLPFPSVCQKEKKSLVCSSTLRQYIILSILAQQVERTVQEESADLFRIFAEKQLFSEFQIKRLIISRPKNDTGSRKFFTGMWCDNASKHTYGKKIEQAFSDSTAFKIYKVESKKSLGAWSFFLLGEEKELLVSSGGSLFQIKEIATAFKQRRGITHKLVEDSPAADKADKSIMIVRKKDPKKGTPHLDAEGLVKRLVSFLFFFAPRLFYRRTINKLAYLWVALIITFIFYFLISNVFNIELNYETVEKFNKFLENLGISIIRVPIPPAPPLPWYHYKSVGVFFFNLVSTCFVKFCSEKINNLFRVLWDFVFKK